MKKKKYVATAVLSSMLLLSSFSASEAGAVSYAPLADSISFEKSWNENAGVPLFVKEKFAVKQSSSNAENALAHLQKNKQKYGIMNAEENLEVNDVQKDDLGMTHVRFNQTKDGVRVEGAEIIVHYNEERMSSCP